MTNETTPTPDTNTDKAPAVKRGRGGRFAKGTRPGPGKPVGIASRMQELKKQLFDAVSDDDFQRVIRGMVEAAASGDVAAGRLLLDHLVGKPQESIDVQIESTTAPAPKALDLSGMEAVLLAAVKQSRSAKEN